MYNYKYIFSACLLAILLSCSGNFEPIPSGSRAGASSSSELSSSSTEEDKNSSSEEPSSSSTDEEDESSSSEKPSSSSEPSSSSLGCTVDDNTSEEYCSNGEMKNYGSLCITTDAVAKKCYKTVIIDNQEWMAENMNTMTQDSKCPGDVADCFGRLYTWNIALSLCPYKWYLPNDEDWNALQQYISGLKCPDETSCYVGKFLKDKSLGGTDDFGFSAQLDGNGDGNIGNLGVWWSASDNTDDNKVAYVWKIFYNNDSLKQGRDLKQNHSSVRCMRNL